MENLFTLFKLKKMEARNRIVMPPMCMYSAANDGFANSWHFHHYETRASGGTGLIIMEATAVESCGRISDRDLGIWSDSHIKGLQETANRIKGKGAKAGIQLAHAGRKCTVKSEKIIAPSPIVFDKNDPSYSIPSEMTDEDIERVIESFRQGAERALAAGFDIIEIHGAHGYLISEFLSPLTNKREDSYGGGHENCSRFLREVLKAVREVWPEEKPVSLRVSAIDFKEGGNEAGDLAAMINLVKDKGIDIIHVSTGGVVHDAVIKPSPGFQLPAASLIRAETGLPVIGGGLVTQAAMANETILNRHSDLVFLGRELLRNPYWPYAAAKELGEKIDYRPVQYERAYL